MKLRQKLAMVLATAMVITAVPVTTMAASTNSFNKTVSITADKAIATGEGLYLDVAVKKITQKDLEKGTSGQFFVSGKDFKFAKPTTADLLYFEGTSAGASYKVIWVSETELRVEVEGLTVGAEPKFQVPVVGTPKKGNPAIVVDGDDFIVSNGSYALVKEELTTDKTLSAKVDGDPSNISVEGFGNLGTILVEEKVANALSGSFVYVDLDNSSDLEFDKDFGTGLVKGEAPEATVGATVKVEGKRGLAGTVGTEAPAHYYYELDKDGKIDKIDTQRLVVDFTYFADTNSRGGVAIKEVPVKAEDPKAGADKGEVKVEVRGVQFTKVNKNTDPATETSITDFETAMQVDGNTDGDVKTTLKTTTVLDATKFVVSEVKDFGVSFKIEDVKDIEAGKGTVKYKVTLKENAVGTLTQRRDIFLTLENAEFVNVQEKDDEITDPTAITLDDDQITIDLDKVGFTTNELNEIVFEVEVQAEAAAKGDIMLVAKSRDFAEDVKTKLGAVAHPYTYESKEVVIKTGLMNQVSKEGYITLKETADEKFTRGTEIVIFADTVGFEIKDAKVEVTEGDLKVSSEVKEVIAKQEKNGDRHYKQALVITIDKESDEASTIKVNDITIDSNRIAPEGKFDVTIAGNAISDRNESLKDVKNAATNVAISAIGDVITLEDFIQVGTKNTEDLPNAAAAKEIVLTVNSTEYTVNGEAKTADAAAFIDANNRTMVPVRFVAEEFGKIDFGTVNGVGTVTVFKDGSVLQFQNGSNIMNKNGIAIPMDTTVVIKDGRTYVPFKYVADGLGINYSFDAATKSITFTNQAQ